MNSISRFYICLGNQTCREAEIWVLVSRVQVQAVLTLFRVPHLTNTAGNIINYTIGSHTWKLESGVTNLWHIIQVFLNNWKLYLPKLQIKYVYLWVKPLLLPTQGPVKWQNDNVNDVLVKPAFKNNLLLVSKLTRDLHCSVSFFPDFFFSGPLQ